MEINSISHFNFSAAFIPVIFVYFFATGWYRLLVYNNLSLFGVLTVTAIFIFLQNLSFKESLSLKIRTLAKYTFGIYLIHYLNMLYGIYLRPIGISTQSWKR